MGNEKTATSHMQFVKALRGLARTVPSTMTQDTLDYQTLFRSIPGACLVVKCDAPVYTVVEVSDAYTRLTGVARASFLGRPLQELGEGHIKAPGGKEALVRCLERVMRCGESEELEPLLPGSPPLSTSDVHADPSKMWKGTLHPILSNDGSVAYVIHGVEDVTDVARFFRKRAEWAALVAHDLRQPLNSVSMCAQLLAKLLEGLGVIDERAYKYVATVGRASKRLQRMIGDLQDDSTLESNRMSLQMGQFDLRALVSETIEQTPELAGRCHLRVEDDLVPRAWGDPDRVQQVVMNLLSNAAKYSEPGTPVGVELQHDAGQLRVTVENVGRGISAEDLPRVFNRFERGTRDRSGTPGLGLGLHICKGLVEAQGGQIWAESSPNALTRFHFTLDVADENAPVAPRSVPPPPVSLS